MKRRMLLGGMSVGAMSQLTGCDKHQENSKNTVRTSSTQKTIEWTMVTTWPKNFQILGEGAEYLARTIEEMSGGRLKINVLGAGELVPPFQVFDTVASGAVQMGHGAAYYWKGKIPIAPFFSGLPFGLTAQEMNAWLIKKGGLSLWQQAYQPFNLLPLPAGNTGVQMAGWFNREIQSLGDIKGLKMRIPGLGGEVLKAAGGSPELIAGGEVFTALQMGRIDAAEWVGPHNDLALGLYKAAKYYYYPGWQEPGTTLEAMINLSAYKALPDDLQSIVKHACLNANADMLADFTAKNYQALKILQNQHKVQVKMLPDDVLKTFHHISKSIIQDQIKQDKLAQKVLDSITQFKTDMEEWSRYSEFNFYQKRTL
ncbi:MAG: TRAP transporter substrate-binding protein [Pseudomonadota bacterium]